MTAVSLSKTGHSIDDRMLRSTEESSEFPFNTDYNSGHPLGFGATQVLFHIAAFLITINIRLGAIYDYFRWPP